MSENSQAGQPGKGTQGPVRQLGGVSVISSVGGRRHQHSRGTSGRRQHGAHQPPVHIPQSHVAYLGEGSVFRLDMAGIPVGLSVPLMQVHEPGKGSLVSFVQNILCTSCLYARTCGERNAHAISPIHLTTGEANGLVIISVDDDNMTTVHMDHATVTLLQDIAAADGMAPAPIVAPLNEHALSLAYAGDFPQLLRRMQERTMTTLTTMPQVLGIGVEARAHAA